MNKLVEYDKDNISDAILRKLKKYVENPKFTPETVEKVSRVLQLILCYLSVRQLISFSNNVINSLQ